ncbi:transposon Ty3-G gag-pol polyprotein [Trifolium medium]|uniref:Transposon Ty3-G gag-pol polyprotein n=1 Tax=Trifolium medium TaxID=97028 RepID=A0A392MUU1_9FABA|nr:transposon Ty3-G gag-pol polyprotein [Trifolium medium]
MAAGTHNNASSSTNPPDRMDEFAQQLAQIQALFQTTLAEVFTRIASLERRSPESVNIVTSAPPVNVNTNPYAPRLKLDVPRFDGTNPHGWIFKISQFFEYHRTPEEERMTVASFYLDDAALAWYQWMYRNGQIVSWTQFLLAPELRFAPTAYDDPKAPTSLNQASGLARLQEEKINDLHRSGRNRPNNSGVPPKPSTIPVVSSGAPLLPTPATKPRFRQLSAAEMDERREKGFCFNCDERFSRNHRCKARFLLLIADDDDDSLELNHQELLDEVGSALIGLDPGEADPTQLSFHALSGIQTAQTIRVLGQIESNLIQVLVDGGSTLNFVQQRVTQSLGL